ncbi:MAG: hypoxanthine phosphoribosyltransferase [Alphaproteobacteria bacterium]
MAEPGRNQAEDVRPLFGEHEIAARVDAMAASIAVDFADPFLVMVALKGAFVFAADLVRALSRHGRQPEVSFLRLSSYADSMRSSGEVRVLGEAPRDVAGQRVLLIDDILDTGRTLQRARSLLHEAGAAEVRLCVLLDKPARREVDVAADYIGFPIDDLFVVGYGLDYAERFRTLPYIGTLAAGGGTEPG